jgi:multicomponent Na+:H+ antiporter subunit C
MEPLFAILVGLFFAAAIYLMLSKFSIRIMLGIAILGNAVNLLLFTGRPADARGAADHCRQGLDTLPPAPPIRCRRR